MLSPDSVHAYSEAEQLAAAAAVCSLAASHAANGRLVVAQGGTARLAGFILPRVAAVARIGGGGGGGKDAARVAFLSPHDSTGATREEVRQDTDGEWYTRAEFVEYYGSAAEWEKRPAR